MQTAFKQYSSIQKEGMSGRELEASALTKGGLMLKACQENWEDSDRQSKLLDAITFNQKVWNIFQSEVAQPTNPLPTHVRQDILNLSIYVVKTLFDIMANPDLSKVASVYNINFRLASGLRNRPAE